MVPFTNQTTSTYSYNCSYACNSCFAGYTCSQCSVTTYSCTQCAVNTYTCTACTGTSTSVQDRTYTVLDTTLCTACNGIGGCVGSGSFSQVVYDGACNATYTTVTASSSQRACVTYHTHSCTSTSPAGTYPNCNCGTTTSTTYTSGGTYPTCSCGISSSTSYTSGGTYPSCSCGSQAVYSGGGSYPNCSCGAYSYGCSTGTQTNTNYYLRLIRSVGGSVSTVAEYNTGAAIGSVKAVTLGNQISFSAYSDSSVSNLLGSVQTYSEASPTTGIIYGIIKAPSDYNQGSTLDNFFVGV